ncbi:YciI family protein [Luteolibacter luteus]|uniref:YCII-related domain-containing protein n=1 Tax=Luteolibacter luteus TaxID=2728835 RepID=A0A858RCD8_9BACT|nr:YciI family protein [Luteolibacter luteus]QJE94311.1 hypothetical protein HHL09_00425 [Luteolibacter luteus]
MKEYLVTVHHADDFDPATEDEAMDRAIDELNEEMIAAGIRVFVGGLHHASTARSLRAQPDGTVSVTEGSYLQGKEHACGFWVLEAEDMDEAVEWGRKAALACRAPIEVREFHEAPE